MSSSHAASLSRSVVEPQPAENLVAALDLQPIEGGGNRWIVHVLGIHSDGRNLWVQLGPHDDGTQSIVLRLSRHATARHALAALAALSSCSLPASRVVPVMCTC